MLRKKELNSSQKPYIPVTIRKLNARTFREWETSISKSSDPPTFTQLQEWFQQRVDMLETIAVSCVGSSERSCERK